MFSMADTPDDVETFGVKAFSEHLAQKFGLESVFLDYPTGL